MSRSFAPRAQQLWKAEAWPGPRRQPRAHGDEHGQARSLRPRPRASFPPAPRAALRAPGAEGGEVSRASRGAPCRPRETSAAASSSSTPTDRTSFRTCARPLRHASNHSYVSQVHITYLSFNVKYYLGYHYKLVTKYFLRAPTGQITPMRDCGRTALAAAPARRSQRAELPHWAPA